MARERDWIDYANLGSNLYQNLQLGGVQEKLGTLASAAALEQAKVGHEDRMREMVFQADTMLIKSRTCLDENRAGVLAVALFTLAQFKKYKLTSASFRKFEDKDRLRSVLEGFRALVQGCESNLSADERADAQLCARYMENPAIEDIVAPPELAEQLRRTEQEMASLLPEKKQTSLNLSSFPLFAAVLSFGGLLFGGLLLVVGFIFTPINDSYEGGVGEVGKIGIRLCATCGVLFLASCAALGILQLPYGVRRKTKVEDENSRLRSAKAEEIRAIRQRIEDAMAQKRKKLEEERDALMEKVLKGKSTADSATV